MGEGQKIAETDAKAAALKRRFRAAARWYWYQKAIDAVIVLAIVACIFVGYAGYGLECILLLTAVIIVASWRFYSNNFKDVGYSGEIDFSNDFPDDSADSMDSHSFSESDFGSDSGGESGGD
jgi:hypothetical protein